MAELCETVAMALPEVGKDKCPICEKSPHPDRTTTDKKEGKGCLKSIPANLGCTPLPIDPTLPNYTTAAHHLIPANQCLKPFKRLSQMCDTVGYNVNNTLNGHPLPTCGQQALNSYVASTGKSMKYGDLADADKTNVAFLIMAGLNMQWHVGHHAWVPLDVETDGEKHPENYDNLVKIKLRELEKDVQQEGDSICEPPDESESGSSLIAAMNALSGEIRGFVVAWQDYFVSARACAYAQKYK